MSRPITYVAVGMAVGYMASSSFYRGSDIRDCGVNMFQYGRGCRQCSDWVCPVGQYRQACSQHADSYCALCTNKPSEMYTYTTPGNDNDCEYKECSSDASGPPPWCTGVVDLPADFSATSPTELVLYAEMPVDPNTFNALGASYRFVCAICALISY